MLLVDTYPGAFDGDNFAKAVYQFIVDYHALPVTTPRSEENFDD
jgi:hypothetical protein